MRATRAGAAAGTGAVALGAAGLAADYPELTLLAAGCAAALAVAAGWLARARTPLTATRRITPPRPAEGSPVTVTVEVTNPGSRPSPPVTAVERIDGTAFTLAVPPLAGHARHTAAYEYVPARRGRLPVSGTSIVHGDPFGLLTAVLPAGPPGEIRVHPRRHPGALPPAAAGEGAEGRAAAAHPPFDEIAFHSLREYRPGDPLRLVHWRATARRGTPIVRQQAAPDEADHLLLLDTDARVCSAVLFEDAVRVTASLAAAIRAAGLGLDLRTTGGDRPLRLPRSGAPGADLSAALDLLTDVAQDHRGHAALPAALAQLPPADGTMSLTVITGRLPATAATALSALSARRGHYATVHVVQLVPAPPPAALDGIRHIAVASSEEFVTAWNGLVRS